MKSYKRKQDEHVELEPEVAAGGSFRRLRARRILRSSVSSNHSSHRKANAGGGIHQRRNKKMN